MTGRLAGRKVLVVGAGTRASGDPEAPIGNGRAISVLAAREGAAVACADVDRAAADETVRLVAAEGTRGETLVGDVTDERDCAEIVEGAVQVLGGLDGVVCNVGIGLGRGLGGTTADEWDAVHAVNVRSHFLVCRAALPAMAEGGAIVFISSVAGLRPRR
jgi:NAD(P)-dependent dehydrogenase (short-subunit alcohol dehydrogenase family)